MKRQLGIPAVGIFLCLLALLLGRTGVEENGFTLEKYHNADAKFLGNQIITSVDEGIRILDLEGQTVAGYDGLSASWLYVAEEDAAVGRPASGTGSDSDRQQDAENQWVVAYSNHANETHILRIAKDNWLNFADRTVLTTDTLAIDPILVKAGDEWLLTHTTIEGTINNPDPDGDNGVYTVRLYRSDDLENWEFVTDIISRKQNLEDGDIRYLDGVLYYFFEMEDYDKGPSRICVMTSGDAGESWSEPKALTAEQADNEMASCEWIGDGWRLYLSSDAACPGESYQGASVYYVDYPQDFSAEGVYHRSSMPDNEAVRLYEAKEIDGQLYFLFARNFLTDCDLLLRTIEKEE